MPRIPHSIDMLTLQYALLNLPAACAPSSVYVNIALPRFRPALTIRNVPPCSRQLEGTILRKTLYIPFDLLIKGRPRNSIKLGQIAVEHDFLTAD